MNNYPKSLWAAGGVYEVTSPRVGSSPSGHHKLGVKKKKNKNKKTHSCY